MNKINKILKKLFYVFLNPNQIALREGVTFGKNCIFRTKLFGSEPYLISVGDNFKTAGNVQFVTHDGGVHVLRNLYSEYEDIDLFGIIQIGNNVFIGYGAIILPGTTIGNNVIVGAGSVVKGKLESDSIYAGVPVKKISDLKTYEERNKQKFINTKHMDDLQKRIYLLSWNSND